MGEPSEVYRCEVCGRKLTQREQKMCDGKCEECYELEIALEIDDIDYQDGLLT